MAQNRLEVLFEELVSNTIRHGFAKGSGQSIHVQVERGPDAVTLVFEDDGSPFDPTQADCRRASPARRPRASVAWGSP